VPGLARTRPQNMCVNFVNAPCFDKLISNRGLQALAVSLIGLVWRLREISSVWILSLNPWFARSIPSA
jgi:hypothetical protein